MKDKKITNEYYKCDICGKEAKHFNETMRKGGGGGTIVNLCDSCMAKLPAINRQNRI